MPNTNTSTNTVVNNTESQRERSARHVCINCGQGNPTWGRPGSLLCNACHDHVAEIMIECTCCHNNVPFTEGTQENNIPLCRPCLDERPEYWRCPICDQLRVTPRFADRCNIGGIRVCPECQYASFFTCAYCHQGTMLELHHVINGTFCCPDCYNRINPPDPVPDPETEAYPADKLHDYSFKPAPIFHPLKEESDTELYLGIELEIHAGKSQGNGLALIGSMAHEDHLYCKRDGSLDWDTGIEIVSHPCTLEYHQDRMRWDSFLQRLALDGATSQVNGQCGLHVHVSRAAFVDSDRACNFGAFIYYHFRESGNGMVNRLARRDPNTYCESTQELREGCLDKTPEADHYNAVNYSNRTTIEVRCARGTLNNEALMSWLEFIAAAVEFANTIDEEIVCDEESWEAFEAFVRADKKGRFWHLVDALDSLEEFAQNAKETERHGLPSPEEILASPTPTQPVQPRRRRVVGEW